MSLLHSELFIYGLNDAYYVTFGLSLLALVLSFTLPARPRKQGRVESEPVAASVQPAAH